MTKEWEPSDTYVCACGHCCSSYMLGIAHEKRCEYCQRELRGEDEPEEEEDMKTDNQWGVWDTQFDEWDSGPYSSPEEAEHACYPGAPQNADVTKYRRSKSLEVKIWEPE